MFSAGQFSACEVGDLSGKFGKAVPVSNRIVSSPTLMYDPLGYYQFNYLKQVETANQWASVVFHCSTGARLFCAKFLLDSAGTSTCAANGAFTLSSTPESDLALYTVEELTSSVLITAFVAFTFGICSMCLVFVMQKPSADDDDDSLAMQDSQQKNNIAL